MSILNPHYFFIVLLNSSICNLLMILSTKNSAITLAMRYTILWFIKLKTLSLTLDKHELPRVKITPCDTNTQAFRLWESGKTLNLYLSDRVIRKSIAGPTSGHMLALQDQTSGPTLNSIISRKITYWNVTILSQGSAVRI